VTHNTLTVRLTPRDGLPTPHPAEPVEFDENRSKASVCGGLLSSLKGKEIDGYMETWVPLNPSTRPLHGPTELRATSNQVNGFELAKGGRLMNILKSAAVVTSGMLFAGATVLAAGASTPVAASSLADIAVMNGPNQVTLAKAEAKPKPKPTRTRRR
jgi:hypothetical protein